jgi:chromosome segregation ATPase
MLRVPRGMEEAIAAVLADQIEAFVFERQADAVAAIESLVRQNGPRVTAIPLDAMKQVYPLSLMKEKGVLGVAAQLVKYPQKYEKLINDVTGPRNRRADVETAIRLLRWRPERSLRQTDRVRSEGRFGGRGRGERFCWPTRETRVHTQRNLPINSPEITDEEADMLRQKLREAEGALAALARETDGLLDRRLHLQDALSVRQQKLAQLRGEMRGLMGSKENVREQQRSYAQQAATLEAERAALLEESREAGETSKHLGKADDLFKTRRGALAQAAEEAVDALVVDADHGL